MEFEQTPPPLSGIRCPYCKSSLECNQEKIQSDLSPGITYVHIYQCPKCDYLFKRHRKTPNFLRSIRSSISQSIGILGESVRFKILSNKGYDLWAFSDLAQELSVHDSPFYDDVYSEEYLLNFFDSDIILQKFIDYCDFWSKDPNVPSGKTFQKSPGRNRRGRSINFGPDWVGKKNGQFYLIEVKTNTAKLQKYQKKMLIKSKDFGFIPLVVRLNVSIDIPLEKIKIIEL